jgi:hypothetical protein
MFQGVFGVVTWHALSLVQKHCLTTKDLMLPCTGLFNKSMGLPCAHVCDERRHSTLLPDDFHPHWYWDRESPKFLVLEPLWLPRWNKATRKAKNTNRELSGFEYQTPRRAQPICSACRNKGHTMASRNCPNKLYAAIAESNQQAREEGLSQASSALQVLENPYTPIGQPPASIAFAPFIPLVPRVSQPVFQPGSQATSFSTPMPVARQAF